MRFLSLIRSISLPRLHSAHKRGCQLPLSHCGLDREGQTYIPCLQQLLCGTSSSTQGPDFRGAGRELPVQLGNTAGPPASTSTAGQAIPPLSPQPPRLPGPGSAVLWLGSLGLPGLCHWAQAFQAYPIQSFPQPGFAPFSTNFVLFLYKPKLLCKDSASLSRKKK